MMIKVKTLTGKEIEVDIDGSDRIERIKERVEEKEGKDRFIIDCFRFQQTIRECFRRDSARTATSHFRWKTNVRQSNS